MTVKASSVEFVVALDERRAVHVAAPAHALPVHGHLRVLTEDEFAWDEGSATTCSSGMVREFESTTATG
jgi:hypothetical protein